MCKKKCAEGAPAFGFGLDESSALARKIYENQGVNCTSWEAVDRTWRARKAEIGNLLDPKTWRTVVTIERKLDGESKAPLLRDAMCGTGYVPTNGASIPTAFVHPVDCAADAVCPGSPLLRPEYPKIKKGQKLSRAWTYVFHYRFGLPLTAPKGEVGASEIVGKAFAAYKAAEKGILVLSVNILDILLQSEHCGFSSCHGLSGCHSAGPLQYLSDSNTAVAYFSSFMRNAKDTGVGENSTLGEDAILPFKTWRQIVHVDKGAKSACFMRNYGQDIGDDAHKELRRVCAGLLARLNGIEVPPEPLWQVGMNGDCHPVRGKGAELAYLDHYTKSVRLPDGDRVRVSLADEVPCPSCGDSTSAFECSRLVCKACRDPLVGCDECGKHTRQSTCRTTGDGRQFCESCWLKNFISCTWCGGWHEKELMTMASRCWWCPACAATQCRPCQGIGCTETVQMRRAVRFSATDGRYYCSDACCNNRNIVRSATPNEESANEQERESGYIEAAMQAVRVVSEDADRQHDPAAV